jgi:hypothetical protein
MEKQLSDKIKIVEQENNSEIVYVGVDGSKKGILFNADGVYVNTTIALDATNTIEMPLAYSSAFQTATLATALLPLANSTQWATGTLSSALMPISYSSGFQTATLASTFLPIANLSFGNIANFSLTYSINGVSTTIYIKTT